MIFINSSNVLISVDTTKDHKGRIYVILIIGFVTETEANHRLTDLTLIIKGQEEGRTLACDISWWNAEHTLILKAKLLSNCQEVEILNTGISIFVFLDIN